MRFCFIEDHCGAGRCAALAGVRRCAQALEVWRLDRLGRSLPDLIGLIINTSTINGKFTFHRKRISELVV